MAETVPDWHDRYRGTLALEWVFTGLYHRIHHPAARGQATAALRHQLFRPGCLLAILPTFVGLLIPGSGSLRVIRILRLLRAFRV